ncbi:unnamed protein product, partial [Mesorhabditis spiculigera]
MSRAKTPEKAVSSGRSASSARDSDSETRNAYVSRSLLSNRHTDTSSAAPVSEPPSDAGSIDSPEKWSLREAAKVENAFDLFKQSSVPFFIAGLVSISCGQVLSLASRSKLFESTPELLCLSIPLMGLKGNIDMTYASRLTTLAHQGALRTFDDLMDRMPAFLATVQTQAIPMAIFSAMITYLLMIVDRLLGLSDPDASQPTENIRNLPLIAGTSLLTICLSAGLLCCLTGMLVFCSRKCRFNPDNVTVPLAASTGDLVCIVLLYGTSHLINLIHRAYHCPLYILLVAFVLLLPMCAYCALKTDLGRRTLKFCWVSLTVSALLQCIGGCILNYTARRYPDCTLYQPILTGIAGNRVGVYASRLGTFLHSKGNLKTGTFPDQLPYLKMANPLRVFYRSDSDVKAGRILVFSSLPYQLAFILIAYGLGTAFSTTLMKPRFHWSFALSYLCFAAIQITLLMIWGQLTCYTMWALGIDPDIHSIPLLTGLGDLQGCALLLLLFELLSIYAPEDINFIDPMAGASTTTITSTTLASMIANSTTTALL